MSKYQTVLNRAELEAHLTAATAPDERRRLQLLLYLAAGTPLAEIVAMTGYRPRSIRQIAQRYVALGAVALVDRRVLTPGAAPLLSAAEQAELRQLLQQEPPAGGAWTRPQSCPVDRSQDRQGGPAPARLGISTAVEG